jgi:hypothetical protein
MAQDTAGSQREGPEAKSAAGGPSALATELSAFEQLVLVLNQSDLKEADPKGGRSQQMLVFLGRTKNQGWQAIGLEDSEEFRKHWRTVAMRLLKPYLAEEISQDRLQKVDLAVELSIARFERMYRELRDDFLEQPNQTARMALLTGDSRYERLRQMGRDGPFRDGSLLSKVIASMDTVQQQ